MKTGQPRGAALKHEGEVIAVAFSPDGQTALTGSWDKHRAALGCEDRAAPGRGAEARGSRQRRGVQPRRPDRADGQWDNTARLWDVKTGQPRGAALKHEGVVNAVAFSPDGQTALTGSATTPRGSGM